MKIGGMIEVKAMLKSLILSAYKLLLLYVGIFAGVYFGVSGLFYIFPNQDLSALFMSVLFSLICILALSFLGILTKFLMFFLKRLPVKVFSTARYSFVTGFLFSIAFTVLMELEEIISRKFPATDNQSYVYICIAFGAIPVLSYVFIVCVDYFVVSKSRYLKKLVL